MKKEYIYYIILAVIVVAVCISCAFILKNSTPKKPTPTANSGGQIIEQPIENEIEEYTVFKSDLGYTLEYNKNRFITRQADGKDYFIALEGQDKIENQNIYFSASIIPAEDIETVKGTVFADDANIGDCVLPKDTLRGIFTRESKYSNGESVERSIFLVNLSDGSGRAILIETQYPNGENNIWKKVRFDHMLNTIQF